MDPPLRRVPFAVLANSPLSALPIPHSPPPPTAPSTMAKKKPPRVKWTVPALGGGTLDFAELRGKPVVLHLFDGG